VALFYARQGLTLSHYDAKAHLVVARRILDSLTPEYSQIGAVWLPLPHLLNLLPVQIDVFYRTGASAVAISVLAFGLACYSIARIVQHVTGSRVASAIAVVLFALNPDVLYLQSTPMTESLLLGLTLLSVSLVYDWVEGEAPGLSADLSAVAPIGAKAGLPAGARDDAALRAKAGLTLVAACLTRYEAWFVTAALLALAGIALLRRGLPAPAAVKSVARLAVYPVAAIVAFIFHSRFTIGEWFVAGGFFVPGNTAQGHPVAAFGEVVWGVRMLAGNPFVAMAVAGMCVVLITGLTRRERASCLVVLALAALMALPSYAFYQGHPFRMRYMVAPAVSFAVFVGIAIGALRGWALHLAAAAIMIWVVLTARPLDPDAAMVQEAQWDRPFSIGRRDVTTCLMRDWDHEPILASMGSLAHYMQELSSEGIDIRDFVHEGNMPYWQEAVESPRGRVGWILVEERAEGGDVLAARARASSAFLSGFTRACSGGGVALYKAVRKN
jgi:hypothetical protein